VAIFDCFDPKWLFLAVFGPKWLFLAVFGQKWLFLTVFGSKTDLFEKIMKKLQK
jgi:hypothetical protein